MPGKAIHPRDANSYRSATIFSFSKPISNESLFDEGNGFGGNQAHATFMRGVGARHPGPP
jgi:hypothetical protein